MLIAKTAERCRDGSLYYFSHNCDQSPDKKQFRDSRFTLGSQFEDTAQHSKKGMAETVCSLLFLDQKQRPDKELGRASKSEGGPPVSHSL